MVDTNKTLIQNLTATGVLKSQRIVEALRFVDRQKFVAHNHKTHSYKDQEIPTFGKKTISKPSVVIKMLEMLNIQPKDRVLEIGAGSGWVLSLMNYLCLPGGYAVGTEISDELVKLANRNISTFSILEARVCLSTNEIGLPKQAPFDKILVSAFSDKIHQGLLTQLTVGGVLVIPIKDTIVKATKLDEENNLQKETLPGYISDQLVHTNSEKENIAETQNLVKDGTRNNEN